jgi:hypothetical protein
MDFVEVLMTGMRTGAMYVDAATLMQHHVTTTTCPHP